MNENTIKHWIELSDYDLETAKAMLDTNRLLYVGFMVHQSVEKILKAFYVRQIAEIPPYTHNLFLLTERSGLQKQLSDEHLQLLEKITPLNIQTRYPKYKDKIFKSLTFEKCKVLLKETREFQKWLKKKLEKN